MKKKKMLLFAVIVTAMTPLAVDAGPLEERNAAFNEFHNKLIKYENAIHLGISDPTNEALTKQVRESHDLAVEATKRLEKYANNQLDLGRELKEEILKEFRALRMITNADDDTLKRQIRVNRLLQLIEQLLRDTNLPSH